SKRLSVLDVSWAAPLQERKSSHRNNVFVINTKKINTREKIHLLMSEIPRAIHCATYRCYVRTNTGTERLGLNTRETPPATG
ncbi:hypothetical protein L9F63_024105, partial [Diploptera punctata]